MKENSIVSIETVIENLISIHPLLTKSFSKSIRLKSNLNPGSLYVLGALSKHEVLSMSEIGCKLSMPKPHVTGLVDKLIAENLVERLNDPNDRRIVNIKITQKGIDDFKSIKKEITLEFRKKLELLDENRLIILSEATEQVKEILNSVLTEQNQTLNSCKSELV
jgi:DNA-binding MarR family transcriptional regulator